jgi:methylase of polypeptide subunit release factors
LDLNVIKAMREAQEQLNKAGIASPQLEAGMLMGHLLNCPRERLYMDRDRVLTPEDTLVLL